MKIIDKMILTCSLAGLLISCTGEAEQALIAGQEKLIEQFIENEVKAHPEILVTSQGGTDRLTLVEGDGKTLDKNGTIEFYYAAYVLSRQGIHRSQLIDTNRADLAESYGWKTSDEHAFDLATLNLQKDKPLKGLENGLVGVREGEECYLLFSTKSAFGEKKLNGIPINSGLIYHIWVEKVTNE